jgi:hypothetical protein
MDVEISCKTDNYQVTANCNQLSQLVFTLAMHLENRTRSGRFFSGDRSYHPTPLVVVGLSAKNTQTHSGYRAFGVIRCAGRYGANTAIRPTIRIDPMNAIHV